MPKLHRYVRVKAKTLAVSSLEIRANRLDLLSRLADDLAHEVKNPLHAMAVNMALLQRRVSTGESKRALERAALVEQEIGRIDRLVDALLLLLRHDSGPVRPAELDVAMDELMPLIEVQCKLARVEVDYDDAGMGARVFIRRGSLRHALLNLVANALEAMRPAGGRLTLCAARTAAEVELRIGDTGPGVNPEDADRIGTPGFSTRDGHAGLGIAVARALVEDAGGRLELETAHAAGAVFLLALPLQSGA